jgi:hypothetical protein
MPGRHICTGSPAAILPGAPRFRRRCRGHRRAARRAGSLSPTGPTSTSASSSRSGNPSRGAASASLRTRANVTATTNRQRATVGLMSLRAALSSGRRATPLARLSPQTALMSRPTTCSPALWLAGAPGRHLHAGGTMRQRRRTGSGVAGGAGGRSLAACARPVAPAPLEVPAHGAIRVACMATWRSTAAAWRTSSPTASRMGCAWRTSAQTARRRRGRTLSDLGDLDRLLAAGALHVLIMTKRPPALTVSSVPRA